MRKDGTSTIKKERKLQMYIEEVPGRFTVE